MGEHDALVARMDRLGDEADAHRALEDEMKYAREMYLAFQQCPPDDDGWTRQPGWARVGRAVRNAIDSVKRRASDQLGLAVLETLNERSATEAQRFLATKFEARCTELEATIESGRSMNAVLRTQLAEAKDEAATLRGQLADVSDRLRTTKEHEAYLEADTAKLSDALTRMRAECAAAQAERAEWAHKCGEAQAEARELREGRATWVTDDDETRRLVVRSVVETEVGCVGPTLSEKASWQVEYGTAKAEGMCCIEPGRDFEQAMCRAQRIVEAVAGVRP